MWIIDKENGISPHSSNQHLSCLFMCHLVKLNVSGACNKQDFLRTQTDISAKLSKDFHFAGELGGVCVVRAMWFVIVLKDTSGLRSLKTPNPLPLGPTTRKIVSWGRFCGIALKTSDDALTYMTNMNSKTKKPSYLQFQKHR